jgi:hypothetical protein
MRCPVDVLFPSSSEWRAATLTDEHATCRNGQPMIEFGEDEVYGPGDIQSVRAPLECPFELYSAAAKAGFHLIRKKTLVQAG